MKNQIHTTTLVLIFLMSIQLIAQVPKEKILFVLTSHSQLGDTGKHTGYYLSEVSHPWDILTEAGYEIDFVSPQGGQPPVDGFDLKDSINTKFWNNNFYKNKLKHTLTPSQVNPKDYVAIHFAGGHGSMWDFADNSKIAQLAAFIYENNGIVSAVCHGPSGLVNIKLNNGRYLVDNKRVSAFTNEEETLIKLDKTVPYSLENKLIERGAIFEKSAPWQMHITVDNRLITGQNPQSAHALGKAILQELTKQKNLQNHLPDLHQAIINNNLQKAEYLIQQGADVNQLDPKMGNAPLHIAAQLDNPKFIDLLIAHGAFVNLQTPHAGHTPLMVAAWYNKIDNVKALLKAKDINIFAQSPYGGKTAKDFIEGFDKHKSPTEQKRYDALLTVFKNYENNLVTQINSQVVYQTVIHPTLSDTEKAKAIKQLIKSGASVNTESFITGDGNDKHSPLLISTRNGYLKSTKVLLDAQANIGQRGYLMNAISFHKAGYMGNSKIMELLVNHKDAYKYINDQGLNNGYTPLHDAIWHGNTKTAEILIKAGADLKLKTYEGDTPLDLAKRYNYADIITLIENNLK